MGESRKTAQAILGHSDLETTLNTYMHAAPDSQRRAPRLLTCPSHMRHFLVPESGAKRANIQINSNTRYNFRYSDPMYRSGPVGVKRTTR